MLTTYAYYALDLTPISLTQSLESLIPNVGDNIALYGKAPPVPFTPRM